MDYKKTAKLVTFHITTRIVGKIGEDDDSFAMSAIDKIKDELDDYLNLQNLEGVVDDDECPYGFSGHENEIPQGPAVLLFPVGDFERPEIENMGDEEAVALARGIQRESDGYCMTPDEYAQMMNDQEINMGYYWIKFVTIGQEEDAP